MVVDSSALLAILFSEPDSSAHIDAILNDAVRFMSAATYAEASIVCIRRSKPGIVADLDILIASLGLRIVPVDIGQAVVARDAYKRFGKGINKAGLNFGDCFSYALAKSMGEKLLFKGNDFGLTDILQA